MNKEHEAILKSRELTRRFLDIQINKIKNKIIDSTENFFLETQFDKEKLKDLDDKEEEIKRLLISKNTLEDAWSRIDDWYEDLEEEVSICDLHNVIGNDYVNETHEIMNCEHSCEGCDYHNTITKADMF